MDAHNCVDCKWHQPSDVIEHVECVFPVPIWIRPDATWPVIVPAQDGASCMTWEP